MTDNDIDLRSFSEDKKDEGRRMLDDSMADDYLPIQKNSRLFKFILYTAKVEIKSNSLIKMIYTTSLFELGLWLVGVLIFLSSPKNLYLIWVLIFHLAKSILGFVILESMPKTYEIIENVAKNPNFDEDKIIDLIQSQIRETFIQRWTDNKKKLLCYLICTAISFIIDIVIFIVQICVFGKAHWFLMQTSLLFIMLVFIVSDVVYFLWFLTLRFSFPDYLIDPIKKAIFGSVNELKSMIFSIFRKKKDESAIN